MSPSADTDDELAEADIAQNEYVRRVMQPESNGDGEGESEGPAETIADVTASLMEAIESVPEVTSPSFWDEACKSMWWPFEDSVCIEMRCTACTPSVASAGAVCKMNGRHKSHRCMQKVMGEGYCNYCIVEFNKL